MTTDETTKSVLDRDSDAEAPSVPAVLAVASGGRAVSWVFPLAAGRPIALGRETHPQLAEDKALSRKHVEITLADRAWTVRDLGSKHGIVVNGQPATEPVTLDAASPCVVRAGRTLFVLDANASRFGRAQLVAGDPLLGPALRPCVDLASRAATAGRDLLITGEIGTGKELIARTYHRAGAFAAGPFIPALGGMDESTVATQARAAEGGVLYFAEIADTDLSVQVQLLRILQSRELQEGAGTRQLRIGVCASSARDLARAVSEGSLRADLVERLYAQAHVHVPALRRRLEEIPFFIELALARYAAVQHATEIPTVSDELIERCLLAPWPGNVRALVGAIERAADLALSEGPPRIALRHLNAVMKRQEDFVREDRPKAIEGATTEQRAAIERAELFRRLQDVAFDEARLAEGMNVSVASLRERMERLGIASQNAEKAPDSGE